MPFGNFGWGEILIVLLIALVVFGPKRLPEMGKSLGKGIREFKSGISGDHDHAPETTHATVAPEPAQLPPAAPPPAAQPQSTGETASTTQ